MSNQERPTLKTIARITGLAVPTVSRALSGAEDIGKATRERVRKVADEIGYVPNRAGVRLRTGRTYVISLILSTEADVMNLTARLINAAASALRKTPYHLVITPYFPDEDSMRPVRHVVETKAADAMIINQVSPEDERIKYLLSQNFPFASHGRSIWSDQHAYYDFDNRAFGVVGVQRLAEKGRKSVTLLAPPIHQNYSQEMIEGVRSEAEKHQMEFTLIEGLSSDEPNEVIEKRIAEICSSTNKIESLITGSSNACIAAVSGIEKAGLTLGKDIDVMSKESIPFLERFRPAILTQHEDAWTAGDFLIRAAIERIEKPENDPMQFLEVPTYS